MSEFPPVLLNSGTFTEHNGIWISYVGEDGDIIALGHHDLDRATAAFTSFDGDALWSDDIDATWAVLTDPTPDDGEPAPWWMQWGVNKDAPGAFPVMVVVA